MNYQQKRKVIVDIDVLFKSWVLDFFTLENLIEESDLSQAKKKWATKNLEFGVYPKERIE